jgi:hypothetical protein
VNSPPTIPHSRSESRKSFRRTLLRRQLHKLCAVVPVTHLDGITYRRNVQKSRKSFRRLLLPLFVPVSPLGAHSYEKMGVPGGTRSTGFNLCGLGGRERPKAPLCNSFRSSRFQASCKAPLSKSFRITLLQKHRGGMRLSDSYRGYAVLASTLPCLNSNLYHAACTAKSGGRGR